MQDSYKSLLFLGSVVAAIALVVFGVAAQPILEMHPRQAGTSARSGVTAAAPTASAPTSVASTNGGQARTAAAAPAVAKYTAPAQEPHPALAPPYNPADVVDLVLTMDDQRVIEVAPDTYFEAWTYNATVPGPVIRVKQGATVNVTLINEGRLPHSLDFHSARTQIGNYRDVMPNESFTWSFVAKVPGVFMYHCGTPPALQHIGNGMYGVMIVDPDPPLPAADREYVLVQSEYYLGAPRPDGVHTGDITKMQKLDADIVAFNGHQSQYKTSPLRAEPGELVRFYVVDAGPSFNSAFHIVGEIFESVYASGNPTPENLDRGVQTALVPVGGGALFEVRPEEAGDYLFVSHAFADANRGAVGTLRVGELPEGASHATSH